MRVGPVNPALCLFTQLFLHHSGLKQRPHYWGWVSRFVSPAPTPFYHHSMLRHLNSTWGKNKLNISHILSDFNKQTLLLMRLFTWLSRHPVKYKKVFIKRPHFIRVFLSCSLEGTRIKFQSVCFRARGCRAGLVKSFSVAWPLIEASTHGLCGSIHPSTHELSCYHTQLPRRARV